MYTEIKKFAELVEGVVPDIEFHLKAGTLINSLDPHHLGAICEPTLFPDVHIVMGRLPGQGVN